MFHSYACTSDVTIFNSYLKYLNKLTRVSTLAKSFTIRPDSVYYIPCSYTRPRFFFGGGEATGAIVPGAEI